MSLDGLKNQTIRDLFPVFGVPNDVRTCACPACGAERRGKSERRYAFGLRGDGRGGKCHRCGFSADIIKFAQQLLLGRVISPGDRMGFSEFCRAAERAGIMTPRADCRTNQPQEATKKWVIADPAVEIRERPPIAEIRHVWDACGLVSADPEVSAWARSRGLDPALMAELDVFRALPPGQDPGFPWLRRWMIATRRAVFPVWNENGELCSLRFRAICDVKGPKSTGPNGKTDLRKDVRPAGSILRDSNGSELGAPYSVAGAVLANSSGVPLLRGKAPPDWDGRAVIVEGEPDFATWAPRAPKSAVFGIWSGSWTPELAAKIPNGTKVIIRTHLDRTGDAYAKTIIQSLRARCTIHRLISKESL